MALEQIKNTDLPQGWDSTERAEIKNLLNTIIDGVNALNTWGAALATKLNADGGVTDTNYDTTPL